jgi:hypothetical protein
MLHFFRSCVIGWYEWVRVKREVLPSPTHSPTHLGGSFGYLPNVGEDAIRFITGDFVNDPHKAENHNFSIFNRGKRSRLRRRNTKWRICFGFSHSVDWVLILLFIIFSIKSLYFYCKELSLCAALNWCLSASYRSYIDFGIGLFCRHRIANFWQCKNNFRCAVFVKKAAKKEIVGGKTFSHRWRKFVPPANTS